MAGGKLSAKKLEIAIRRNHVLSLRRQGGDWREIAETLRATLDTDDPVPGVTPKYDHSLAYKDALAEMNRLSTENKEMAAHELTMQLDQLRELWAKFYGMAVERGDYMAFDRCMTIQERRARLMGVEPAKRQEVTGSNGEPLVFIVQQRADDGNPPA